MSCYIVKSILSKAGIVISVGILMYNCVLISLLSSMLSLFRQFPHQNLTLFFLSSKFQVICPACCNCSNGTVHVMKAVYTICSFFISIGSEIFLKHFLFRHLQSVFLSH